MILDDMAKLTSATAFDLETVRPGPGQPIKMMAIGVGGSLAVTTGDTTAAADACVTVDATNTVEFELPSNVKRYIEATFASGDVYVILPGAQTNK